MKILVTGSAGMVGSAVKKVFKKDSLILTDIKSLDVRDYKKAESYFKKNKIDAVLHLAALTDLEECESDVHNCYMTNYVGAMNIAFLSNKYNALMIYISTAGIFDGSLDTYDEESRPNPVNHYGMSKLFGEYAVSSACFRHYIIRAGWMMGGGINIDKKFINKIVKKILSGDKAIYALTDYFGSPTYTVDFVSTIKALLERMAYFGIYHAGGEGRTSRYEVAKEMFKVLGLTRKIKLVGVQGDYFKDEFPCKRSKGEVLDNFKIRSLGVSKMRDWKVGLGEYLRKEFLPPCR